jgi:cardiolipin synthase
MFLSMTIPTTIQVFSLLTFLAYAGGILSTYHVIMSRRSSQAVIAWSISLCTFPVITLPVYWIFGRTRFHGYVDALRSRHTGVSEQVVQTLESLPDSIPDPGSLVPDQRAMEKLGATPYTDLNQVDLLINGEATFSAIFEEMRKAQSYILIQFYIIHDGELGRALLQEVREARSRGVSVHLLYDEIGSTGLGKCWLRDLNATGAKVSGFRTTDGPKNRFQLNFRNHRKIVVVDGHTAFVGGHNVGDEYMGKSKAFGPWRDTHCRIQGPAVLAVQLSFATDWNWAQKQLPEHLNWIPRPAPDRSERVLVVPSGPADKIETWKMVLLQCIRQADDRLWLVSPYFVPDEDVLSALELADLRGVDIRILLPNDPDHLMVWMASFAYLEALKDTNIHFYRYLPGFLHQKVVLVDDELAIIGTANVDCRSFSLNFEISITGISPDFIQRVSDMLEEDFQHSRQVGAEEYDERPITFRVASKICRLMAPIL